MEGNRRGEEKRREQLRMPKGSVSDIMIRNKIRNRGQVSYMEMAERWKLGS